MFKKALCPVLSMLVLMVPVAAWGAGSQAGNVTITATVAEFFEWPAGMAIAAADFGADFNAVSQQKTATKNFSCNTNVAAGITIAATAGDANAAVLTGPATKTLTSEYWLDGDLSDADVAYMGAAAFINPANTYSVTANAGSKTVTLNVRATTAASAADAPAGNYSCVVTLTASW